MTVLFATSRPIRMIRTICKKMIVADHPIYKSLAHLSLSLWTLCKKMLFRIDLFSLGLSMWIIWMICKMNSLYQAVFFARGQTLCIFKIFFCKILSHMLTLLARIVPYVSKVMDPRNVPQTSRFWSKMMEIVIIALKSRRAVISVTLKAICWQCRSIPLQLRFNHLILPHRLPAPFQSRYLSGILGQISSLPPSRVYICQDCRHKYQVCDLPPPNSLFSTSIFNFPVEYDSLDMF